jgi:hypothetical protein
MRTDAYVVDCSFDDRQHGCGKRSSFRGLAGVRLGVKAWLSRGGAYDIASFKKLEGQPNWTMEWNTDDQPAKAAFERIVRSVQTQIELE